MNKIRFQDKTFAIFDAKTKKLVSCRDGVQEYIGAEISEDLEPGKTYSVYRSADTIASIKSLMDGLAITDEHIDFHDDIPDDLIVGKILTTSLEDAANEELSSTVNLVHDTDINTDKLSGDKKELSLGYLSDIVTHDEYDFEQTNIIPHHLAIVAAGRCGDSCKFLDNKKGDGMKGKLKFKGIFKDVENESVNMEAVVEIVNQLPEAIKKLPVDKLQEIAPMLKEIMSLAKVGDISEEDQEKMDGLEEENKTLKEDAAETVKEVEAKDKKIVGLESDLAGFAGKEKMTDSTAFKDAVKAAAKTLTQTRMRDYSGVVEKAKLFVDEGFDFAGKTPCEIMDAAVSAHIGDDHGFKDEQLETAFAVLKKSADYKKFGDKSNDKWDTAKEKEIK